ncbi:MAG: DUF2239 family protein [Caulobacter sp.]|nr:DUF2239 family protein [Caulobacter sp.]
MTPDPATPCTAFDGMRKLAAGSLAQVAPAVRARLDAAPNAAVLILADDDARRVEVDLRGTVADVAARYAVAAEARGPGRPKLGVVPREVTLLPRHWAWLSAQPGGASVALRKLVEAARRDPREQARSARDRAYRFMTALAGDAAGFEAATRALYADDEAGFTEHTTGWPTDVRDHALVLASPVWGQGA